MPKAKKKKIEKKKEVVEEQRDRDLKHILLDMMDEIEGKPNLQPRHRFHIREMIEEVLFPKVYFAVVTEDYLPYRKHKTDACWDLKARGSYILNPRKTTKVFTGLFVQIPEGYHIQISPRGGLAVKYGVTIINSPGIVDADYRGEVAVLMTVVGTTLNYRIDDTNRIAQMRLVKNTSMELVEVTKEKLSETERGEGGFGSTGK